MVLLDLRQTTKGGSFAWRRGGLDALNDPLKNYPRVCPANH